jgi:hypothetical protein
MCSEAVSQEDIYYCAGRSISAFGDIDFSSCIIFFMVFNILLYVETKKHNILRLGVVILLDICDNKCKKDRPVPDT